MKTTRIEVEGARGEARLSRVDDAIRIEARWLGRIVETKKRDVPVFETAVWEVPARTSDEALLERTARRLQATLDGYEGTHGDVAAYQRVLEMLGD